MSSKPHLVIIGGGPAGIAAALAADTDDADVTLISQGPVGGRAGWHSLLPSKVLLTASDNRHHGASVPSYDVLVDRIRYVSDRYNGELRRRLEEHGVVIRQGMAQFVDAHTLELTTPEGDGETIAFDRAIVATGSVPIFPPNLKPNGKQIVAPRFVSKLEGLPERMILVGGGITGTEFVYAFSSLGVKVLWLVDEYGVLPPYERDVTGVLVTTLLERGVELVEGTAVAELKVTEAGGVEATLTDGRQFQADQAFVAIGRRPDVTGLNLQAAGFSEDLRALEVDAFARTSIPQIYAAGDITGAPLVVNKAWAQAWTAGRHATGQPTPELRPETWVEAVYSQPQVAQIGLTEERATNQGKAVRVQRIRFANALKALLLDDKEGFLKLVSDPETGKVLGASAVGDHAADVLAPIALAIQTGATVADLAASFAAHPTLTELAFEVARSVEQNAAAEIPYG